MSFQSPIFFLLIPLVLAAAYYARKKNTGAGIKFSTGHLLTKVKPSLKARLQCNLVFLRITALFFIIIALTRPRAPIEESKIQSEGIDIVLAVDVSTSMLAEDFKLEGKRANRLAAVKDVVKDFIRGRQSDRIGITAFAGRAYTISPLTLDYEWLLQNLERVEIGMIEDGTAVGLGISSSLNRLKDTPAKSKVVVLLTDGRNNTGNISPSLAAQTAKSLGVKVYTIGAGTKGMVPYPAKDFFGNTVYQSIKIDLDEDTLTAVAEKTGAKYFRATDTKSLREIYKEIDRMEKTPVEEKGYLEYKELFSVFLFIGLIVLFLEVVLSSTFLRKIP